ncbi:MAG: gluconokinase [Bacteroidota bacterium]|nr:gluconokinase [Bacteroidota bacterium]
MNCIIGVDIGTTSTKAIAFDISGNILSKSAIKYPIFSPTSTYSEQDPEEIFQAVLKTVRKTWEPIKESTTLLGISFSSAMHGIMPVDINGTPLTHCIIWADTRSKVVAQKIKRGPSGAYLYQRTGTPIHPMSPLCKIVWLKENMPQTFAAAYKFISIKEYVFLKFFNKYLIDYSVASSTGLFDIHDLIWNKQALIIAGINESKLSTPKSPYHQELNPQQKYVDLMGIPHHVPFIIGANDGCLANLGSNAIEKGRAAITIGTSGAIRIASPKPVHDQKSRIFNYILTKDYYIAGGPVNNGGIVLQWFLENISRQKAETTLPGDISDYSYDLDSTVTIEAGSEGLIFLPYILGERAPHWDADARGVFFGLNIKHTRAHMIKAILEGIVYGVFSVAEALESTGEKIEVIYANGGFARSDEWVQILTDVFGKKVLVSESVEGSAWGAAIMGYYSLGKMGRLDDQNCFQEKLREFIPNQRNHTIYNNTYKIYSRLYEKLKDEFLLLNTFQN